MGLNRIVRHIAWWMPGMGVVVHRGRRTGREYRTPLLVFGRPGGYVVALPYGTHCDWVRNVEAAGAASLHTRRRRVPVEPRLAHVAGHPDLRRPVRAILTAAGVHDYLELAPTG